MKEATKTIKTKKKEKKGDFFGLKQFVQLELLGQGSSGFVYLAEKKPKYRCENEPTNFAMKLQKIELKHCKDMLFEPKILMQLNECPRVIRCFFTGFRFDVMYICMEYYPYTLETFLKIPENRD